MKSNKKINKTYDLLLKKLTFNNLNSADSYIDVNNINIEDFIKYFLLNSTKSSKFGQILPSVVFLIISLISFSVAFLNSKLAKFWALFENNNIKISIIMFGIVFLILGLVLLAQKYIFKIKVIYIYTGYSKGYKNISNKKYNEIMLYLVNKIKKDEV